MAEEPNKNANELPHIPETLWLEFTPRIKTAIAKEFLNLPDISEGEAAQKVDWMRAGLQYLKLIERSAQKPGGWWRNNFTGLMMISAAMALAFGVMGVWGLSSTGSAKEATAGFLDIAKLFAGTLVGAAGATALVKR